MIKKEKNIELTSHEIAHISGGCIEIEIGDIDLSYINHLFEPETLGYSSMITAFFMLYNYDDLNCYKAETVLDMLRGVFWDLYSFVDRSVEFRILYYLIFEMNWR